VGTYTTGYRENFGSLASAKVPHEALGAVIAFLPMHGGPRKQESWAVSLTLEEMHHRLHDTIKGDTSASISRHRSSISVEGFGSWGTGLWAIGETNAGPAHFRYVGYQLVLQPNKKALLVSRRL
jgi:hypothetical protein